MSAHRTVAILSPGEMGSQVAKLLGEEGVRVLTSLAGRSQVTATRTAEAGVESLAGLDDVVRQAPLILSLVVPFAALPLARDVAAASRRSGGRPLFVDLNAIGPRTARDIGQVLREASIEFVDGCIIGSSGDLRGRAALYLSGKAAPEAAAQLTPLHTSVLGTEPGQASAFKILYAGLTKGLSALGVELMAGAEELGLAEKLFAKYRTDHPSVAAFLQHVLPGLPSRAARRSQEMAELSETLEELGLTAHMSHAAEMVLADVAGQYQGAGEEKWRHIVAPAQAARDA